MSDLSSHLPPDILEKHAAEQRERIHDSVNALRCSVRDTVRERLDLRGYARDHIWRLIGTASAFALVAGYGVAGMFTRD